MRLLAPARPVEVGKLATVRFSVRDDRDADHPSWSAGWDWGDGTVDITRLGAGTSVGGGGRVQVRGQHAYRAPGVYTVRIGLTDGSGKPTYGYRYVTVRREPHEIAGCGWITPAKGDRTPFGFLLGVPASSNAGYLMLRYRTAEFDVEALKLGWVMHESSEALHFGGVARVSGHRGEHQFRADTAGGSSGARRRRRLSFSLYAPGDIAGRDSPLHRVSGVVWPGRIEPLSPQS